MNKLSRKIMFKDMAIRGMPENNITGLAVCAQKNWDVIFRAWHSASKKNPGRNITCLAVLGLIVDFFTEIEYLCLSLVIQALTVGSF